MISDNRNSTSISVSPDNTKTNWHKCSSSHLRIVNPDKPTGYNGVTEIKKLIDKLIKIEGLKRVRAIATSFPDIHWVDFQIGFQTGIELPDEVWEIIQDMIIDCEWQLIDNSGEEWYFRPQKVNKFYQLADRVIVDSENKSKTWSSNSPHFTVL